MTKPVNASTESGLTTTGGLEAEKVRLERAKIESRVKYFELGLKLVQGFGKWLLFAAGLAGIGFILHAQIGQETVVTYIAQIPMLTSAAIGAALSGWGLYLNERRMRKTAIETHHRRVVELEKQIDSNRSSSQLTVRGETREKDRP